MTIGLIKQLKICKKENQNKSKYLKPPYKSRKNKGGQKKKLIMQSLNNKKMRNTFEEYLKE
jgi:hypothetical protein